MQVGCNLEAAVQVLRYLFEPSESFTITPDNFLPLLEVYPALHLVHVYAVQSSVPRSYQF